MSDELYSYHVFLFPFKMRFTDKCEDKIFKPNKDKWKHKPFKIENPENYNEYIYFYDFVREAIYDVGELVQCFEYQLSETTAAYNIGISSCDKEGQKDYRLPIEKITLSIYQKEEIGILAFFLRNNTYPYQEDILKINDFGKRIYPQFLSINADDAQTPYTKATQEAFLAKEINLFLTPNYTTTFKTDFANFDQINANFEEQPLIANFITDLLGNGIKSESIKSVQNADTEDKIVISPLLDDRMFVLCWYGNNELAKQYSENRGDGYGYLQNDFWYQFVFMDNNGPTCQSKFMHNELVKNATNERWANYGTLYGVTRYSFVLLTDNGNFGKQFLLPHLKTMYTKMVMLSLVQRAAILKFSSEVVRISGLELETISSGATDLYKRYIQFVNKIYFREVTPQEQGIELYDLLQKQLRIAEQVKDLDDEIAELHNYVSLLEDKKRNEEAANLTKIATIFLPASLIAGILGMNTLPNLENISPYLICGGSMSSQLIASLLLIVSPIVFYLLYVFIKWTTQFVKKLLT